MTSAPPFSVDYIEVEQIGSIKPRSRVAFCFNSSSWTLLVSNSGHGRILRGRDRRDFDFGGWCDLRTSRLWPTNGTVSNVPGKWLDAVQWDLENHFRTYLEWM